MPTKKRRVGFIPRNDVLEIIGKLSFENNLSYSKIVCILVEEALFKRGILTAMDKEDCLTKNKISDNNYSIDSDSYKKFIMFLKFQEKLKESGI